MSTLAKRLLTFFIGVPLLTGIVFITYQNHIALNLILIIFAALATNELYNMASTKTKLPSKPLIIILSTLLPALSYLFIILDLSLEPISWILLFFIILLMGIESCTEKEFTSSIEKIGLSTLIILYCGFGLSFISRMAILENSLYYIVLFMLIVFGCDSAAWLFGMLFGKNNRGIIKASPNKSIAGFLGGIICDVLIAILAKVFFPEIFIGEMWKMILLALLTSIAAIVGDLIESVFKRSCNFKDSGNLIPGRGGVLDSIDSFIVAAPVFYIAIYFLYFV